MAPVAMILGGISGTISALFGWIVFGLSFWNAVQVYFGVALVVALVLIVMAMLRKEPSARGQAGAGGELAKPADLQRA